jgi:ParB-like chromosome segregation protein Spo0J
MKITWLTEKRKVKDLIPSDYNPRKISEKEREDLIESIKEFSDVEPVVINCDNHLIGGHQRCTIYADLGIEEIDVRVPNRQLTTEEEVKLNLRLNKNTGSWDYEKLKKIDIDTLLNTGFEETELSSIFDVIDITEDEFDEKKAKEEAKITDIKLGDIFKLGEHRLKCGDSQNIDDVNDLMRGEKAD